MKTTHKAGILLSQLLNACTGGDPDESFSARVYRENNEKWIRRIDRLFGAGHCKLTHEYTRIRQSARYNTR